MKASKAMVLEAPGRMVLREFLFPRWADRPFEGKSPQFDKTVFIDPTARLIGDILLGSGVSVFPFALLRADSNRITVGERSVILEGRYRGI